MGEGMIVRRGGGSDLNLKVVMQGSEPANPKENMIWVKYSTEMAEWSMGPENPYVGYEDVNIIQGASVADGVLGTSGGVSTQNSTYKERYTVEHFNVEYGVAYQYQYTLNEAKSQWLAICEYKRDGTFIKRVVLVNSVNGAYAEGTYTPSTEDVYMVRLCWRSFGNGIVELIHPHVEYTLDSTEYGSVWIKTKEGLGVPVSALKKNGLTVYPASARVYAAPGLSPFGGYWIDVDAYVYQTDDIAGAGWKPLRAVRNLYQYGDMCKAYTGGWVKTSGTLTKYDDRMNIKGSTGRIATSIQIDTTGFREIEFSIYNRSTSKQVLAGIGTSQTAFVYSTNVNPGYDDYDTVSLDVTGYQGMYYVQVYTTDSSVGCDVGVVRLVV